MNSHSTLLQFIPIQELGTWPLWYSLYLHEVKTQQKIDVLSHKNYFCIQFDSNYPIQFIEYCIYPSAEEFPIQDKNYNIESKKGSLKIHARNCIDGLLLQRLFPNDLPGKETFLGYNLNAVDVDCTFESKRNEPNQSIIDQFNLIFDRLELLFTNSGKKLIDDDYFQSAKKYIYAELNKYLINDKLITKNFINHLRKIAPDNHATRNTYFETSNYLNPKICESIKNNDNIALTNYLRDPNNSEEVHLEGPRFIESAITASFCQARDKESTSTNLELLKLLVEYGAHLRIPNRVITYSRYEHGTTGIEFAIKLAWEEIMAVNSKYTKIVMPIIQLLMFIYRKRVNFFYIPSDLIKPGNLFEWIATGQQAIAKWENEHPDLPPAILYSVPAARFNKIYYNFHGQRIPFNSIIKYVMADKQIVTVQTITLKEALAIDGMRRRLEEIFIKGYDKKLPLAVMQKSFDDMMKWYQGAFIDLIILGDDQMSEDKSIIPKIQGFNIAKLISTFHLNRPVIINHLCVAVSLGPLRPYRGLMMEVHYWRSYIALEFKLNFPVYNNFEMDSDAAFRYLYGSFFSPQHALHEFDEVSKETIYQGKEIESRGDYLYIKDSIANFTTKKPNPWATSEKELALDRITKKFGPGESVLGAFISNSFNHSLFMENVRKFRKYPVQNITDTRLPIQNKL